MPVKVYFGPYEHSPAGELPVELRLLWLPEFDQLRQVERDFWTPTCQHLDAFGIEQVMVWRRNEWVPLSEDADRLIPHRHASEGLRNLPNGNIAIACEALWHMRLAKEAADDGGVGDAD